MTSSPSQYSSPSSPQIKYSPGGLATHTEHEDEEGNNVNMTYPVGSYDEDGNDNVDMTYPSGSYHLDDNNYVDMTYPTGSYDEDGNSNLDMTYPSGIYHDEDGKNNLDMTYPSESYHDEDGENNLDMTYPSGSYDEEGNNNLDITYPRGRYHVHRSDSGEEEGTPQTCDEYDVEILDSDEAKPDTSDYRSDSVYSRELQEEESESNVSDHNSENSDPNFGEDEDMSDNSFDEEPVTENTYPNEEDGYISDISCSEVNGDVPYPYVEDSDSLPSSYIPNIILYSTHDAVSISSLRHSMNQNSDVELPRHSCPSSNLQFHPVRLKKKSVCMTYILALFLGVFGAHHFYLGRPKFGTLYIFTGGLLGMGYVVDLVRVPWLVNNANLEILHPELRGRKYLMDTYLLWLPPFGLLGFHHFYLGNMCHAFVYLATAGALILGWFLDVFLIPIVWIKKANKDYSYLIEAINHGVEDETVWNTAVTSPHMTPPTPVSPPPYTEIDYTETNSPPSYDEVMAMDMQESYS